MTLIRLLRPTSLRYVELRARSAFSFLRGATLPEDMAARAAELGHPAMALGDAGGLYGVVRFHETAKEVGVRPIVAADLQLEGLGSVRLLVENAQGYRNLSRLLTLAHAGRPKGSHAATLDQLAAHKEGLFALLGHCDGVQAAAHVARAMGAGRAVAEISRHLDPDQERANRAMVDLAERLGLLTVATNDVRHATPEEQVVLDVLTCAREGVTVDEAGRLLAPNRERHLKTAPEMLRLFRDQPHVVHNTWALAERCQFSMDQLPYEFPTYPLAPGETEQGELVRLTHEGARARYGARYEKDPRVRTQLEHELAVIGKLKLAGYFLIVWDISRFARERRMLAQGRGSAANSAVCYALSITAVEPIRAGLLFERFLSEERGDWPDIDLDLPSGDRREEIIQYVYRRYGPRGSALAATVITLKHRMAVREVGKALGVDPAVIDLVAQSGSRWGEEGPQPTVQERMARAGVVGQPHRAELMLQLVDQVLTLPRHLSQHVGGMILARGHLDEVVPLEPAAMPGRTVIQWDKNDIESMKLIKIDLLGLGMLAALEECTETLARRGTPIDLAQLPHDDPECYAAARQADTIGVFQIESRAQQATLPRLRPEVFYDLVVSVGLIRPGPIAGKMVNPFLARRAGREPVTFAHPSLEPILARTLGVPLFQEQLMRVAMVAAGLTGGEAQELRKVMSRAMTQRRAAERMKQLEERMRANMAANGFAPEVGEQIISGVRGFAEYGFPESHAASFALITYASLWLKVHHPAVFLAALLNNQPMGFYSAATLVKDAQRHGVRVKPACVVHSEPRAVVVTEREVRLGLVTVHGIGQKLAETITSERRLRPFRNVEDVVMRAQLTETQSGSLAHAGAFAALGETRRGAMWSAMSAVGSGDLAPPPEASDSPLPELSEAGRTLADYQATGLTVGAHLMHLLRPELAERNALPAAALPGTRNGAWVRTAGLVIVRQRPGTAKGVLFLTLEDETGISNGIVSPELAEQLRLDLRSPLLMIEGPLQNRDGVVTVQVRRVEPLDAPTEGLPGSHDYR